MDLMDFGGVAFSVEIVTSQTHSCNSAPSRRLASCLPLTHAQIDRRKPPFCERGMLGFQYAGVWLEFGYGVDFGASFWDHLSQMITKRRFFHSTAISDI